VRLRTWIAVGIVCATTAACGPEPQSEPRQIDPSAIPFGLLDRRNDGARPSGDQALVLYFVGADRLVAVEHLEAGPTDGSTALRRLLAGPTEREADRGLGTALSSAHAARLIDVQNGLARVGLADDFHDGTIPDQATALAQIVLTLTDAPAIDRVSFVVDGNNVAVPRGDGSLTDGPVARDDYALVAPAQP
jgi:spore germination protein GerM